MNRMKKKEWAATVAPNAPSKPSNEEVPLTEIRDALFAVPREYLATLLKKIRYWPRLFEI